jgi:hypothetical protein
MVINLTNVNKANNHLSSKEGGALRAKKWPTSDADDIYRKLSSLRKEKSYIYS